METEGQELNGWILNPFLRSFLFNQKFSLFLVSLKSVPKQVIKLFFPFQFRWVVNSLFDFFCILNESQKEE